MFLCDDRGFLMKENKPTNTETMELFMAVLIEKGSSFFPTRADREPDSGLGLGWLT